MPGGTGGLAVAPKTILMGSSANSVPRPEDAGVALRGRSCNSSSPPLNLLEELVWKFQPIFKGYFHSSEIYQRRRVIFTARSNCRLPWQRAGRNAIKHPSVIVNTKGTTGTEKKGDCHGGRKATPWCAHQDPTRLHSGRFCGVPCAHVGSGGPRGASLSRLPSVSVEGTGTSA